MGKVKIVSGSVSDIEFYFPCKLAYHKNIDTAAKVGCKVYLKCTKVKNIGFKKIISNGLET